MNYLLKVIIGGVIVGIIVLYIEYRFFSNEEPFYLQISSEERERKERQERIYHQEQEQLRLEREKEQERLRLEREEKFKSNLLIDKSYKFYGQGYKKPEKPRTITKIILLDTYSSSFYKEINGLKEYNVAYHYLIERNGNIHLLVEEKNIAFHTSKQNDDSIGIGIGIMHTSKQNYPYRQKRSIINLLNDIMSRHNISKYRIYTKSQLDPRSKSEIIDILDDIREKLDN